MDITGSILVGDDERRGSGHFQAIDPRSGMALSPDFAEADEADVTNSAALAAAAFPVFRDLAPDQRAKFLEGIADEVADLGDRLIERAMAETGLPRGRLEGERARTIGQLRLFASVLREGSWLDATIDPALPDRLPQPRADLRRMNIALGPVAVFGASNFPLAFSVAGGDTASALAAGCPVIVKGHPAHPGTGELVARALRQAVRKAQLPAGVFSYLPGARHSLSRALVSDSRIKAVGFTGSRSGGLALVRAAAERAEPIPVYAEMSSINPIVLFPAAAQSRGAELGKAFVASLTLGAGQFCTNPGLVIAVGDGEPAAFLGAAAEALTASASQSMLTQQIHAAFESGVASLAEHPATTMLARGSNGEGATGARGALFTVAASDFIIDPALSQEVFGSSSIVVVAKDVDEAARVLRSLEGQLTATLLFDEADEALVRPILPLIAEKAGRVLANGWPTGVEVCHAMVHGGPYPATSDVRTTSVGALAIARFLRPVCFQDVPDRLLPPALRADNPYDIPRRIDGQLKYSSATERHDGGQR